MRPLTKLEVELISGGIDDDGDTITVTGDPSDSSSTWSASTDSTSTFSSSSTGDEGGEDPAAGNTPPQVSTDVVDPANAAQVAAAAAKLEAAITEMNPKVAALSDTATISLPDGTTLTGAEFKERWNNIDFVVTDRTYGADRAGAFESSTGTSYINADAVNGWDLSGEGGLEFIILHEVAHSLDSAETVNSEMWANHVAGGGTAANYDANSAFFQETEEFVNIIARDFAQQLGITLDPNFQPTNGYEYGDLTR